MATRKDDEIDPLIFTIIISLLIFIVALYVSVWINSRVLRKSIKDLKYLDGRFEAQRREFRSEIELLRTEIASLRIGIQRREEEKTDE